MHPFSNTMYNNQTVEWLIAKTEDPLQTRPNNVRRMAILRMYFTCYDLILYSCTGKKHAAVKLRIVTNVHKKLNQFQSGTQWNYIPNESYFPHLILHSFKWNWTSILQLVTCRFDESVPKYSRRSFFKASKPVIYTFFR